jgi:uncharacterized protein (DUF305 family)
MVLALAMLTVATGCVAPASPPADPAPPTTVAAPVRRGYTAADVAFMQGMIAHHGQALAMTAMIPSRTQNRDFLLMAERINVSQASEIALMKKWLAARGEAVPEDDAHEHAVMGHGDMMPGMLNAAQLDALSSSAGVGFEKLFLLSMIRHHEGAIAMVEKLFRSGSGVEPELFLFATDVNADQSAEIKRMKGMLGRL